MMAILSVGALVIVLIGWILLMRNYRKQRDFEESGRHTPPEDY